MTVLLLLAALVPQQVLIATPRGQVSIPVMNEQGAAAVAAVLLARPLGVTVSLDGSSAHVTLGDRSFDFDIGSPFVRYEGDRKSTCLNSSHVKISYAVFCL